MIAVFQHGELEQNDLFYAIIQLFLFLFSCEYKHNLDVRIGGKKGRFSMVDVTSGTPCYK